MRTLAWTALLWGITVGLATLAEAQIAIQLSGSNGGGPRPPGVMIHPLPGVPLFGDRSGLPGSFEPKLVESDLAVVAKLVRDEGVHEIETHLPGSTQTGTWELQRLKFEVGKVFFDRSASSGAAKPPKTLSVFTPTQMPPREIGARGMRPHIRMAMPPPMRIDNSYILFLKKLSGGGEYYLDPVSSRFDAQEKTIQRVEAAAKIDQWPWGKPAGALQMCVLLPEEIVGWARDVDKGPGSVPLIAHIALRNVGKQPLRIAFGPDSDVTVKLSGEHGREIQQQVFPRANYERKLQPGEIALLGWTATAGSAASMFLNDLAPGPYTITVRFTAGKGEQAGDWSGDLLSAPVRRTIKMRPQTPLITRPRP